MQARPAQPATRGRGSSPFKVPAQHLSNCQRTPAINAPARCSYPESRLPPEEAALALERWFFLVQGHGQPHFMQALAANADWEPPG